MPSREAQQRFWYNTPAHLLDAARALCAEPDREYPYLAEFERSKNGAMRLFSLDTVSLYIGHDGEPRIGRTGWDVDWIERDQGYAYHQSSGGGSLRRVVHGNYWRHPEFLYVAREAGRTRRLRRIPIDLEGNEDLLKFLECNAKNCEVYFCSICQDHLPDDDLCDHAWWCDGYGLVRGPGTSHTAPCADTDCYGCSRARENPPKCE